MIKIACLLAMVGIMAIGTAPGWAVAIGLVLSLWASLGLLAECFIDKE